MQAAKSERGGRSERGDRSPSERNVEANEEAAAQTSNADEEPTSENVTEE